MSLAENKVEVVLGTSERPLQAGHLLTMPSKILQTPFPEVNPALPQELVPPLAELSLQDSQSPMKPGPQLPTPLLPRKLPFRAEHIHSITEESNNSLIDLKPPTLGYRYKTEMCRTFLECGYCNYGAKCQFAHGPGDLRGLPRHPKFKTELCRTYHTSGICTYGYRCHFVHSLEEWRDGGGYPDLRQSISYSGIPSNGSFTSTPSSLSSLSLYSPSHASSLSPLSPFSPMNSPSNPFGGFFSGPPTPIPPPLNLTFFTSVTVPSTPVLRPLVCLNPWGPEGGIRMVESVSSSPAVMSPLGGFNPWAPQGGPMMAESVPPPSPAVLRPLGPYCNLWAPQGETTVAENPDSTEQNEDVEDSASDSPEAETLSALRPVSD